MDEIWTTWIWCCAAALIVEAVRLGVRAWRGEPPAARLQGYYAVPARAMNALVIGAGAALSGLIGAFSTGTAWAAAAWMTVFFGGLYAIMRGLAAAAPARLTPRRARLPATVVLASAESIKEFICRPLGLLDDRDVTFDGAEITSMAVEYDTGELVLTLSPDARILVGERR